MKAQPPPGPWRPNPTVPERRGGARLFRWKRRPRLPSIEVLRLEPGDILIVTPDHELTKEQADYVQSRFAGKLPGHEVLVVSDSIKLSVIRPEDR